MPVKTEATAVDRGSLGLPLATALLALAGLYFHFSAWSESLNLAALDTAFKVLRVIGPIPASDDIVIVSLDAERKRDTAFDPALRKLPDALVRVARGRPRAIALDAVLPSLSLDPFMPGFDDAIATALVLAQASAPLVIGMSVDLNREVIPIAEGFLRGVDPRAFAFALLPRDRDGVVRQAVVALPTQQGRWPTLAGWLCQVLSDRCEEGMINYALGRPYTRVSMSQLLEHGDDERLQALFRGRVVFLAEIEGASSRLPLPTQLAGWEADKKDSPAILAHAQTLRTLMRDRAVRDAPLPIVILVITASALLAIAPRALILPASAVATATLIGGTVVALWAGVFFPPTSPALVVALAAIVGRWIR